MPDRRLGQKVAAAVIPVSGMTVDPAGLDTFAEEVLGPSKRPTAWLILDEFPRTASGKVRKHVLQQSITPGGVESA